MIAPHNLEAEQSAIGAVLVRSSELDAMTGAGLDAAHFYRDTHRKIWWAILELRNRGEDIDSLTVSTELERRGGIEGKDAKGYVHQLAATVPVAAHAGAYARIVVHEAKKRRAREELQPLSDGGADLNGNASRAIEALSDLLAFEAGRPDDGVHAAPLASVSRERVEWSGPDGCHSEC